MEEALDLSFDRLLMMMMMMMKNGVFRFPTFTIQSDLKGTTVHILICTEYPMAQSISYFYLFYMYDFTCSHV